MDPVGTGLVDGFDLIAQVGEIGAEDGGGDVGSHGIEVPFKPIN
jgi:hypothetical protein